MYHRHPKELIQKARELRADGLTYSEIKESLGVQIPKGTLSDWCHNVVLPASYQARIAYFNKANISKALAVAVAMNKAKRERFFEKLKTINSPISEKIADKNTAKIALAMLCLGEATKSVRSSSALALCNTDPRIIILFIELLRYCFHINMEKIRCTVQCRADQDIPSLTAYWQEITHVPEKYFYKAQVDPRTVGKPTLRVGYKGVLRVTYPDRKIQLELESLADLAYNQVLSWVKVQ